MPNQSQLLFPIINPVENSINAVDQDGNTIYESLRLQFILGSTLFDERNICKTICEYLKSNLCADKVLSYDGTEFHMNTNDTDTPFQKEKRIYLLYDDFINKCLDVMVENMKDVFNLTPSDTDENIATRNRLCSHWLKLVELKIKYLEHSEAMKMIQMIKYII